METTKLHESLLVSIHWHEIEAYVRAFFPSEDPGVMAKYRGQLILDMDQCPGRAVDVLPLLKLRLYAPEIHFELISPHPPHPWTYGPYAAALAALSGLEVTRSSPQMQDLAIPQEEVLDTQHKLREETRASWYGQASTKVLLSRDLDADFGWGDMHIEMHVQKKYACDWMSKSTWNNEDADAYWRFFSSLGLVDMWSSVVDIVVEGTTRERRTRYTGGTSSGW